MGLVRSNGKLELSGGLTRGPQALSQGHNQIVYDIVEFKVDEKEEEVKGDVVDNWMLDKICMYFQTSSEGMCYNHYLAKEYHKENV